MITIGVSDFIKLQSNQCLKHSRADQFSWVWKLSPRRSSGVSGSVTARVKLQVSCKMMQRQSSVDHVIKCSGIIYKRSLIAKTLRSKCIVAHVEGWRILRYGGARIAGSKDDLCYFLARWWRCRNSCQDVEDLHGPWCKSCSHRVPFVHPSTGN